MKKLIAMLTVLAMLAAFAVPTFAADITAPKRENDDVIIGDDSYQDKRDLLDDFYDDWDTLGAEDALAEIDAEQNDNESIQVENSKETIEEKEEISEYLVVYGEVEFDYVISVPAGIQDLGLLDDTSTADIGYIKIVSGNLAPSDYLEVTATSDGVLYLAAGGDNDVDYFEYEIVALDSKNDTATGTGTTGDGDPLALLFTGFNQNSSVDGYNVDSQIDLTLNVTTELGIQSAGYYYDTITFTITPVIDDGTTATPACVHVDGDDDGVCDICGETL